MSGLVALVLWFAITYTEDPIISQNLGDIKIVFDGEKQGFWATDNYWAPEVHKFNGKYYIFGSVKSENRRRGTCIFSCDTLLCTVPK